MQSTDVIIKVIVTAMKIAQNNCFLVIDRS